LIVELQALDEARTLGDIKDNKYEARKQELLEGIGLAKVRARLSPGEEIVAQHHYQQSHFPFTGFAFNDVAQESVSFFATGRRVCRWRFLDHPGRRQSSLATEDRLEALDFDRIHAFVRRREWRWGEAAAAVAMIALSLLLWPYLEFSGPILVLVGAAGMGHALCVPTPYWVISGKDESHAWRVYAARKPSAKALIQAIQVGLDK
jgi:hypothetical protein